MRDSLKKSVQDTPAQGFERYLRGSVIICNGCAKPIYRLERGLDLGQGAGRAASAFKPLTLRDLAELAGREDIDAGVLAFVRSMDIDARRAHVAKLRDVAAGEPMLCPLCNDTFVQVLAVEKHEVLDRAYTLELLSIPPAGMGKPAPIRGKRLGVGKDWIHEGPVH